MKMAIAASPVAKVDSSSSVTPTILQHPPNQRPLGPRPALLFAGRFRAIDFNLSNCIYSQISDIAVLTYNSAHIWQTIPDNGIGLTLIPQTAAFWSRGLELQVHAVGIGHVLCSYRSKNYRPGLYAFDYNDRIGL